MPSVRKSVQDPGSCSRRMVCPVGAVSKRMWSYTAVHAASVNRSVNSLKEAISVVQAPDNCSSIEATSAGGSRPRTGPTMRSRYCAAACSGSISRAERPGTAAIGVTVLPMPTPKTWPTLEAGSVLTSSTDAPPSARRTALAQAMEVLPTPPLPVKKRKRGARSRKSGVAISGPSSSRRYRSSPLPRPRPERARP